MKKLIIPLLFVISFGIFSVSYANEATLSHIALYNVQVEHEKQEEHAITRGELFEYLGKIFSADVAPTYKYIELYFNDIEKGSPEYDALQKLVYLDVFKNAKGKLYPNKKFSAYTLFGYVENLFGLSFSTFDDEKIEDLKKRPANTSDLQKITQILENALNDESSTPSLDTDEGQKKDIFLDVFKTLEENHYDKANLNETKMWDKAIQGLAEGTGDKFTTYFPPIENQSFQDSLSSEYEGIGSYVDMETPGIVKIISPIPGSPSEKAGLKGGDIIEKVNGVEVTEENSLQEAVSWIKGPAGTTVTLSILRGQNSFDVEVKREKIIIQDVESKKLNDTTYYVQIKKFSDSVKDKFETSINEVKADKSIKKIIFDLRNNPGGYLDEVNDTLSLFIEKGELVSIVKYTDFSISNESRGYNLLNLGDYTVVILQNSGTASAAEIMVGTLKDYFPKITTIGEKTYGKGSVQTVKPYADGSSLKFTVAKWFTGKTETGIDGVGISPDIELLLDENEMKEGRDNQLQKALDIK